MNPPRASVVLAAYNAEKYIQQAVESILAQTWRDFEFIVIDDGSTDRTPEILQGISDPRIRLVSRPNKGIIASSNEGVGMARGEIIFRMDADDIARPERFAKQISYLDAHRECVALGTRTLLIDSEGLPLMEMIDLTDHDEIDAANLLGGSAHICNPTVAMRRDAVLQVGAYQEDTKSAEDLDLFLRLAEVGRVANLPDVLLEYRQHLLSVGYAKGTEQWNTANRCVNMARRRRGLPELDLPTTHASQPRAAQHHKWAWWALRGGHPKTARKHALRALMLDRSLPNWKLLACAIRGY